MPENNKLTFAETSIIIAICVMVIALLIRVYSLLSITAQEADIPGLGLYPGDSNGLVWVTYTDTLFITDSIRERFPEALSVQIDDTGRIVIVPPDSISYVRNRARIVFQKVK